MPRTVTMWSESGGVGKTTFTQNVGAALGRNGHDTLLIDLDPQNGGLTKGSGHRDLIEREDYTNLCDILLDDTHHMDEIIVECGDYDLVPTHADLASFEQMAAKSGVRMHEFLLRDEIERLKDEYDYFLVDPPATLSGLVDNALFATRNVMVPIELDDKGRVSIEGLEKTLEAIENGLNRAGQDIEFKIIAIVPNKVGDSNIYTETRQELENRGMLLTPFGVRKRDALKYAYREDMNIFEYHEHPDTDDLREYEQDVLDHFDKLAKLIAGEWTPTVESDDSEEVVA